jgi:NAD(P)-dependent dehydrogenase (short-subunit alcohol dehydrogenase family)
MAEKGTATGRLEGKVALLAGATSGIGRATAEVFGQEGARVVVGGRRRREGRSIADAIVAAGGEAVYVHLDVTDETSVREAVQATVGEFGRLDALMSLAGGSSSGDGPVTEASSEQFWERMKVDLFGTFLCSRFAIPEIIKSGGGSVINMGSWMGFGTSPDRDAYSSAKGAVHTLTRSTARRYAHERVRINAIAPAAVLTERIAKLLEASPAARDLASGQALGLVEPREIANAAVFLASDESKKVTGQILAIHGGLFE